jgi:hypothetical protein
MSNLTNPKFNLSDPIVAYSELIDWDNLRLMTLREKDRLFFDLCNTEAKLKEFLKFVADKKDEISKSVLESLPPKQDEQGNLVSTEIMDSGTGETVSFLEYKQDVKRKPDEEKIKTLLRSCGSPALYAFDDNFMKKEFKTVAEIEKTLSRCGIPQDRVCEAFEKVKGDIKIVLKKY